MLSPDVRRLIVASPLTVPHVEAIVLMRASPQACFDVRTLAARLYVPLKTARRICADLQGLGVVADDADGKTLRYGPRTTELAATLDRLAEAYSTNLVQVTRLIHSIGTPGAQAFADAFTLRKEPK